MFVFILRVDLSQFSPHNKIEILSLEMKKILQKLEENTLSNEQELLEFKKTKQKLKKNNIEQLLIILEKWILGVLKLQVQKLFLLQQKKNKFLP